KRRSDTARRGSTSRATEAGVRRPAAERNAMRTQISKPVVLVDAPLVERFEQPRDAFKLRNRKNRRPYLIRKVQPRGLMRGDPYFLFDFFDVRRSGEFSHNRIRERLHMIDGAGMRAGVDVSQ